MTAKAREALRGEITTRSTRERGETRLWLLTAVLFVSYLCVAIPLPIAPIHVTGRLGLGNVWAGLAIGVAFVSTIVTRAHAGAVSDRRGPKVAAARGLAFYAAGALISAISSLPEMPHIKAYLIPLVGRMLLGLGESPVGVGVIAWGIEIVGSVRAGKVLALIGAAIYGALAVGGPIGLVLLHRFGFAGAMFVSAGLAFFGLGAIWPISGVAPHARADRPSFLLVTGQIWRHGLIACLQGIGFAAIGAFFALYFLHQNGSYAGLGLTAFGGGFVLIRGSFGQLPDRLGGMPVAMGSLAIETLGQLMIWSAHDPVLALVGAFMTGLGCSLAFPAMGREVARLVQPQLRGVALAGFTAFQDLAYGLTGPVAGLLADRAGYGSVFLIGAAAAAVGFLIALRLQRRDHVQPSSPL